MKCNVNQTKTEVPAWKTKYEKYTNSTYKR